MTVITKTCDLCRQTLYMDGGQWMGGEITLRMRNTPEYGIDKYMDLCYPCAQKICKWLKEQTK
jgi:hypothetical protein